LITGSPGKQAGWICKCGRKLEIKDKDDIRCICGKKYRLAGDELLECSL